MRHQVAGKKLGRSSAHRKALRRSLMTELFRHDAIQTTRAKAQAIRGSAERLITLAKHSLASGDPVQLVNARRTAAARLTDPAIVKRLFEEIAPRYAERAGGYTRMYKLGPRQGDAAPMVLLELVGD